jgi:DNA-binding transcriptional LysR family regulator
MLSLAEDASERLREDQGELRGHLRLFATIDIGQSALSRVLSRFLQLHPGLSAELSYSNRPVTMIEGGYDAGVVAGELTDPNVVARKLALIERAVVASPSYSKKLPKPREPSDLKPLRWLALSPSQFGGSSDSVTLVGRKTTQTLRIAPVLIAEGVTSLREAARAGLGICVLPLWLIHEDLREGELVRVLPEFIPPAFSLNALHLAGRPLPSRVRAFLDFVSLQMLSELRGEGSGNRGGT